MLRIEICLVAFLDAEFHEVADAASEAAVQEIAEVLHRAQVVLGDA